MLSCPRKRGANKHSDIKWHLRESTARTGGRAGEPEAGGAEKAPAGPALSLRQPPIPPGLPSEQCLSPASRMDGSRGGAGGAVRPALGSLFPLSVPRLMSPPSPSPFSLLASSSGACSAELRPSPASLAPHSNRCPDPSFACSPGPRGGLHLDHPRVGC